jgi:hypothetical protein
MQAAVRQAPRHGTHKAAPNLLTLMGRCYHEYPYLSGEAWVAASLRSAHGQAHDLSGIVLGDKDTGV